MTPAGTASPTQQLYQPTAPAAKPTGKPQDASTRTGTARGAPATGLGQVLDIVV